jgi:hypothetical protein
VELEKLGEEELARVKAKGYSGGLKVTGMGGSLNFGDILVGLHVWPTESLDQVQEILSRYDMHELSPLKFYVIRQRMTGGYGEGRDDMGNPTAPDPERDEVATGRLEVDLDAWAEKEGFKQERLNQSRILNDSGPAPPSWPQNNSDDNEQATLLYDGKTFDQWRDLWRQDLSTDFRIKAVHAFVAFANAGKGKEAVVEILAIVEQYDWSIIGTSHVDPLRNACIEVFTGSEIPKDMAIEAMVSSDVKNSRILQFLDYVAQPLSQWSKEGNDKLREAFSDRKIPEYVSPEKRKIGAGGGFGRGGYGVIQDITPPEPAARLIPLTPTGEQGLRTIIAPFNKKPVAGSRNTYQFFVLNATTATDSDVELSVEFPPGLVPDMASVKSPIGADLVDNEVKFRPIAMMRPNERISFQITASILKAGEGEIVAKFKSKDSPAKEVRKSVTVVDF